MINAGDGAHQHPTQALLDAVTMRQRIGEISGKKIVIVGDCLHSRVVRSNVDLLSTLGAEVVLVAPPTLMPTGVENWPVRVSYTMDPEIADADVVMMLRVQQERMQGGFFPSHREYSTLYGMSKERESTPPARRCYSRYPMGCMCAWRSCSPSSPAPTAPASRRKLSIMSTTMNYPATGELADVEPGTLLITNVRPYGEGEPVSVPITDGVITEVGTAATTADRVIDGENNVLLPGLVDIHVHLREPGREDTETIATGSAAAAKGGFTAVFTMANTNPVMDQPVIAESVWYKGQAIGLCDVHPVGSITKGLAGKELTEFGMMVHSDAKVRLFSDDGKCVDNPQIMRRAIEYAKGFDVLLAQHCEDPRLTEGAVAHEGEIAAKLGLRGWPRVAEEAIVARDALLCRDYGNRMHICHASTRGTVELVRWAKDQGIPLTAEVTPHHLLLTDERLTTYDGVNRVNPPLREADDTIALRDALLDGTVDCVSTDHAPHGSEEKCCEFEHARPGMLGLETSLAIVAELFVKSGLADWRFVAKVMSERPAEIVQLPGHGRPIAAGEPANLTIVDPGKTWTVAADDLASKADNTPYENMEFTTKVTTTILRGRLTCVNGEAQAPRN